jgi:hypothetical protein
VNTIELPEAFSRGLEALRKRECPEARVVLVDDNFAWIFLQSVNLTDLGLAYKERCCLLLARAPLTFPNADPYGIATVPLLHRTDGNAIERMHASHLHIAKLANLPGYGDIAFWSWEWKGMRRDQPERLADLFNWALKRVRQEKPQ